jgi:hypothetical protein
MAPHSVARGPPRRGDRATAGMPDRGKVQWGANSPILPQPHGTMALRAACLVRFLAKERPRA